MEFDDKQDDPKKFFTTRGYLVAGKTAFGVDSDKECGLRLKLSAHTNLYFPGRLELIFCVRYDENSHRRTEQLKIFLTAKNTHNIHYGYITFETDNIALSVTNKHQLLACIGNKSHKELFSIEFDYDPSNPHAVGFFTSKIYGEQQKAVDSLRDAFLQGGRLQLLAETPNSKELFLPFLNEVRFNKSGKLEEWFNIRPEDFLSDTVIDESRCRLNHRGLADLKLPCMVSFADKDEYSTVMAFANLWEYKNLEKNIKFQMKRKWEMRVFTLPGCGDRFYFALLRVKTEELGLVADEAEERDNNNSVLRLPQGEQVEIDFNGEYFNGLAIWTATRVDFISSASSKDIQLLLKRPLDEVERKYAPDVRSNQLSPYIVATNFKDSVEHIESATPVPVKLGLAVRKKPFFLSLKALNNLRLEQELPESKDRVWQILLGNQPGSLPRRNLYYEIDDLLLDKTTLIEEQKDAIDMMKSIPGGIMLVSGPSNSGKTYTMLHSVLPLLAAKDPNSSKHQILIISSSNVSLETIAGRLFKLVKARFPKEQKMIVLCHSLSQMVGSTMDQAGRYRDTKELPLADQLGAHDKFSGIPLLMLLRNLKELRKSQDYELSLPYWILEHGMHRFEKSESFTELFNAYERGDTLAHDEVKTLEEMIVDIQAEVFTKADIVISTPLVAGDFKVWKHFKPDTVYVDQASWIRESELWPLFAYHNPKVCILLGDRMSTTQLPPARLMENPLAKQLELPFFTRMLQSGVQVATLQVQHGMHPDIANMISNVFYGGQLKDPQPLDAESTSMADRIRDFNSRQFKRSNVIFVNVVGSNAVRLEPTMTMVNEKNIERTVRLVTALIEAQVASANDISVITAYQGQYMRYLEIFQKDEKLREVSANRIDMRDLNNARITIFDLTVSNEIGYMRQSHRLNTALSRGRCGLYIFGNQSGLINAARQRDLRHVSRLLHSVSGQVIMKRKRGNHSDRRDGKRTSRD